MEAYSPNPAPDRDGRAWLLRRAVAAVRAAERQAQGRRRILLGLALAPVCAWLASSRYGRDFEFSAEELLLLAPMLIACAALILTGLFRAARGAP